MFTLYLLQSIHSCIILNIMHMRTQVIFLIAICAYLLLADSCASIEVGAQAHNLPGESDYNDPIGAQAGIIFHAADLNEKMSFRPEINLSMQGATYTGNFGSGRVNLLYANIPLVLRYQWNNRIYCEKLRIGFCHYPRCDYSYRLPEFLFYPIKNFQPL